MLVLLAALFLPWYAARFTAPSSGTGSVFAILRIGDLVRSICDSPAASCSAGRSVRLGALAGGAGGWRTLIGVLAAITLLYLLTRTALPGPSQLPLALSHWRILTGLASATAVMVVIALISNPLSVLSGIRFAGLSFAVSLSYGAFIGLIAAVGGIAGGVLVRPRDDEGPADGILRPPGHRG